MSLVVTSFLTLLFDFIHLAHKVVVNVVSYADAMIKQFQDSFGELRIELILGSSLQTAVVSFRILQKVENIGRPYTNIFT